VYYSAGDFLDGHQRDFGPHRAVDQLGKHSLQIPSCRASPGRHLAKQHPDSGRPDPYQMVQRCLRLNLLYFLRICDRGPENTIAVASTSSSLYAASRNPLPQPTKNMGTYAIAICLFGFLFLMIAHRLDKLQLSLHSPTSSTSSGPVTPPPAVPLTKH